MSAAQHARRGRPRVYREERDCGTPELQFKRAHGATAEALDLCLEKGLITQAQHWCGIHLRWLYTLRYGAPGLRAVDLLHVDGLDIEGDDPDWRQAREAEYNDALLHIRAHGAASALINICVHNERPLFLQKISSRSEKELAKFRDGLDVLVSHWNRREKKAR